MVSDPNAPEGVPAERDDSADPTAAPRRRKPRRESTWASPEPEPTEVSAELPAAVPAAASEVASAGPSADEPDALEAPAGSETEAPPDPEAAEEEDAGPALAQPPRERRVGNVSDYKSGRRFDEFPLSAATLQGLEAMGYVEATQVQAESIEPALAGQDLVVRAKTGTGKTCAFGIPLVERVDEGARRPQGLILSPTRELANQIAQEIAGIAQFKDLRILPVYGGVSMGPQTTALKEGVEIIVGTPGRVLDHMRRGALDLSALRVACLDEADEMLGMGFFKEVTSILRKAPADCQHLLFSATVSDEVKRLIQGFLKSPLDIYLSTDTDAVEGITHVLYDAPQDYHRVRALLALIDQEEPGSTIIFCNTREDTTTVASFLDRQGLDVQLISGDLPQGKREQVMARVKSGEVQFLVATDVAARGIDITDITHVINYTLPPDPAVYMHRVGRTGRIGKTGFALSLAGGLDLSTRLVLEKQFKIAFEYRQLPSRAEADALRVDRQVGRIRHAMGTSAFEGFLPLVRALKERADGEILLAVALKTFFAWEREQRFKQGAIDSVGAANEARGAEREARRERSEGRGERRDRGDRSERRDRGDRSERRDRPERREDRPERREDRPERQEDRPAPTEALPAGESSRAKGEAERKKRKRKRKNRREGEPGGAPDPAGMVSSTAGGPDEDSGDSDSSRDAGDSSPSGSEAPREGGDARRRRRRR